MRSKTTVILFCGMLAVLAVCNFIVPDQLFSQSENRYLAQRPAFSWDTLAKGKLTAEFDEYVIDQFPFRDNWVGIKTLAERLLGKGSSSGVYFGKDGYLIEMFDSPDYEQYAKNLGYLAGFSQRLQDSQGITPHVLLVPTASHVLADKLRSTAPEASQTAMLEQAADQLPGFVNVAPALCVHADEYIYYKTDHHWTSLGALYAYNSWVEQIGEPERIKSLSDLNQEILSTDFYGTTYSKANLYTAKPDTITALFPKSAGPLRVRYNSEEVTDTIYERSYLEVKDKYSVFLNANQALTQISTGNHNGRRLLIIKDSYANAFVQLLVDDYEEIYVVDLRYFRLPLLEFMEEEAITDALVLYNLKGFSSDTSVFLATQ